MSKWHGFERLDFAFEGHDCILVKPRIPASGRPWIWRAEFFGAFSQADAAMAAKGYHLAYVGLSDRYGCPSAVEDMKQFHDMLVERFELAPKAALFGFSRGGLYSVNYALAHPEDVGALYLDAPVLNIRSWPGGKGAGKGAPECWEECKVCYGMDEAAAAFHDNPLDNAEKLAASGIPVLIAAGGSDHVAPYNENGLPFARRFRAAGGYVEAILKPSCGHHPHSLKDPAPIVNFLIAMTR